MDTESLGLGFVVGLVAYANCEFDEAVEYEANPCNHQQSPIKAKRLMLRRRRQVRHEDEEVEQASEDHSGGLLDEAGKHVQWPVAS